MKKLLLGLIGLLFAVPAVAATLPAGYTELEYIADDINNGTKTVKIDTGIAGDNDNLEFEFEAYYDTYEQYGRFFGNYVADGSDGWRIILSSQNNAYFNANKKCSGGDIFGLLKDQWNHVIFNKTFATVNDNTYSVQHTQKGTINNDNISIFSFLNVSNHRYIGLRYKYFIIRDNNVLVRNFIPAKRNSDNEVGMYDTVSGTFFTNAGTGSFIAGPVVPETPIKIATTAYNSARFSPVVTELNTTIATIRNVVTNTINQTKAIADLQATKQTRPNENCPAGKKCLLVEDNDGTPHWFKIVESAD